MFRELLSQDLINHKGLSFMRNQSHERNTMADRKGLKEFCLPGSEQGYSQESL